MSGKPAARVGDMIFCSLPQVIPAVPPVPHAPPPGLPIIPPGALTVLIGGKPAARMGDMSLCVTPVPVPNPIVRGAFPVPIMNMPAARMTDSGTHPGSVIMPPCCPTVLIGLSGTTGNPRLGLEDCQAAAAGRNPPPGTLDNNGNPVPSGTTQQSYNNCGVETSRLLINRSNGSNLTQEGLLNWAMGNGIASQTPGNLFASGGTNPAGRRSILNQNGVASHLESRNMANLELSVSQGRGNIVTVDSSTLWSNGATPPSTGDHVVNVIGLEYDDNGDVTNVIITDTGTGQCQQSVPISVWNQATDPAIGSWQTVVTDDPIW
ncbi:MAG: hypothetical protein B6D77_05575 [gamma proteobacterium symbiont of Ctena orbiculata]|nr:MAG: hypothetical protein B6D77_05575 [gamma proteobacterium symbiont of Ctena orbiculata]PVV24324.1 MAG: hypothetical protein B6D78_01655 [gamma proteobacterium symbiont of Ctena orbiculata]PVV27569.1 MAG: hypothetical protein B6D79_01750 [gamma proteobacterium symbiont of Ctena orbiculata]